ncbi:hypothetical protein V1517DRAFT_256699 [Lipomyces orientalis]|uniref:Uncharacterized protein n=1 Tax=Lipomyces orientalis TaxID=1233043 RepID=A0ACC3TSN4_9ASCO
MSASSSPSRHLHPSQTLPTRPVYAPFSHTAAVSACGSARRRSSLDFTWSAAFASLTQPSDFDTTSSMPEYTYLPQTIMSERRRSELFFPPSNPPPTTGDPMLDAFPYLAIGNQTNYDTGISVMGMVPEYLLAQQYQDAIFASQRPESLSRPRQGATSPVSSASTTSVSPHDLPPMPLGSAGHSHSHSSPLATKWANYSMAQGYSTSAQHNQLSSPGKITPLAVDLDAESDYPPAPPSAPILSGHSAMELDLHDLAQSQGYSYTVCSSRSGPAGSAGSTSSDTTGSRQVPKSSCGASRSDSTDASRGSDGQRDDSDESTSPLTTTSLSNSMSEEEEDEEDDGDDDDEYMEPASRRARGLPGRRSAKQMVVPDVPNSLPTMTYHGEFVHPEALHEFPPALGLPFVPNAQWSAEQYSEEDGNDDDDDDSEGADEDDDESMEDKMARSKKGVYRCNHCPEKFNTMEQF